MADQDLSIVVRVQQLTQQAFDQVSKELKKLETQANQTGTSASKGLGGGFDVAGARIEKSIAGMTTSLLRFAGPAAVGLAIKQTINWADGIADLADKTDISIRRIQQFDAVATATGVPLETMTKAVGELAKRLGEGDKSAVAAVERLGLSAEKLKTQRPEDTFLQVGAAVGKVTDAYQRNALEADLTGRSGRELDGVFRAMADGGLEDTIVASDESVKALGRLSDAFGEALRVGKSFATESLGTVVTWFEKLQVKVDAAALSVNKFFIEQTKGTRFNLLFTPITTATPSPTSGIETGIVPGLTNFGETLREYDTELKKGKAKQREVTEAAEALRVAQWEAASYLHGEFERRWAAETRSITDIQNTVGAFLIRRSNFDLPSRPLPGGGLVTLAGAAGGVSPGFAGPGFLQRLGGLGGALSVGSQLFGNLAGLGLLNQNNAIGQGLSGGLTGLALGSGISSGLSSLVGASVLPALGPIGAGIGIALPLIKKLFGYAPGAIAQQGADRDIRGIQASLLQQFGSVQNIAALGPQGAEVAAAWGSRNVAGLERFKTLVDDLNTSLEHQKQVTGQIGLVEEQLASLREKQLPTWQQLQASAEKYGINLDALGPTFQQLRQNDFSQQLLSAFADLTARGGDVGGILVGMKDEISQIVTESRKFGTTIPENLRPLVEELARSGQLLDEHGNQIRDLSGLQWGPAVKTQAEIISDAITDLTDTLRLLREDLAKGMPAAAREGTQGITDVINGYRPPAIDVDVRYPDDAPVSTSYARGGLARRPTLAMVGDSPNGPEIIGDVPFMVRALTGAMARLRGGVGGGLHVVEMRWNDRELGRMVLEQAYGSAKAYGLA